MAKAMIETSNSAHDPSDLVVEEIFVPDTLPPGEVSAAGAAPAGERPAVKPREVEMLDFGIEEDGPRPFHIVPLKYPFRRDGQITRQIVVRRLTVGEVGEMLDTRPADLPDRFDIYAAMTGLPAPVLRGLIDIDGEAVAEACFDFLPRYYRPRLMDQNVSSSTSDDGAAS